MTRIGSLALMSMVVMFAAAADWPQWGGSPARNNTPAGKNIPVEWDIGKFDQQSGRWEADSAKNVRWVARLGSTSYGTPVVADGRVFCATNNGAGWLKQYPAKVDLGCLLCFRQSDGRFEWQLSCKKPHPGHRLSRTGHLLLAAGRGEATLGRHEPLRGPLPQGRRLQDASPRARRRLAIRHDQGAWRHSLQHEFLLGDGGRRFAAGEHVERRRRGAQASPITQGPEFHRTGQANRQAAVGRQLAGQQYP